MYMSIDPVCHKHGYLMSSFQICLKSPSPSREATPSDLSTRSVTYVGEFVPSSGKMPIPNMCKSSDRSRSLSYAHFFIDQAVFSNNRSGSRCLDSFRRGLSIFGELEATRAFRKFGLPVSQLLTKLAPLEPFRHHGIRASYRLSRSPWLRSPRRGQG